MSNSSPLERPPRVLFLGMQGNFSYPPLKALLEDNIEVCAVIVPSEQGSDLVLPAISRREQPRVARSVLPVLQSHLHTSILQLAWERQIPVWEVRRLSDPETLSVLTSYQPDIICVACFSLRIPRVILDLPRLGCLNVHPSLLPANRGPVPLFWTFREGQRYTGVSIHLMDEGMDTGDILAQELIEIADGISYAELEFLCAGLGGKLLVQAVWDLYCGHAIRVPQDESASSYHPYPSADDFVIPAAEWSAHHVYNFIRGVAGWNGPITVLANNKRFFVREVISYSLKNVNEPEEAEAIEVSEETWVRCKDGWVKIRVFWH